MESIKSEFYEKQDRLRRLQHWFSDLDEPTEGDSRYFQVMQDRLFWDLNALRERILAEQ